SCAAIPSHSIVPPSLHAALPIFRECQETGNVSLVARRHEISSNTIHTWIRKYRQQGSVKSLPRGEAVRAKALEQRLKVVSQQNRSEEHTSELQSREKLVCRRLLE